MLHYILVQLCVGICVILVHFCIFADQLHPQSSQELVLAFTGDVYIDAPTRNCLNRRAQKIGRRKAFYELFNDVAPILKKADIAIVNLETPVSPRYYERKSGDPPIFNTTPDLLDALVFSGVDAITLANNHFFDQGIQGAVDTIRALQARKLSFVGLRSSRESDTDILYIPTQFGHVALCNWTQSLNRLVRRNERKNPSESIRNFDVSLIRNTSDIEECIQQARNSSVFTVAIFHWTPSLDWERPALKERHFVQVAVNAGADLVVGHGPHLPGYAEYLRSTDGRSVPVVFSLGNLVGAMGSEAKLWVLNRPTVRDAPILLVTVRKSAQGRLIPNGFQMKPFWIADPMPYADWWPKGQHLTRPLSIHKEIQRITKSQCRGACKSHARGYRKRQRLLRKAFPLLSQDP